MSNETHHHHYHIHHRSGSFYSFLGWVLLIGGAVLFIFAAYAFYILLIVGLVVGIGWLIWKALSGLYHKADTVITVTGEGIKTEKQIATLRKELSEADPVMEAKAHRLQELKKCSPDPVELERYQALCVLMEQVAGSSAVEHTRGALETQAQCLTEIRSIEQEIREHVNSYKQIGDSTQCLHFLRYLGGSESEYAAIKAECKALHEKRAQTVRTIRHVKIGATITLLCVAIAIAVTLIMRYPIFSFQTAAKEKTLTADMCSAGTELYDRLHTQSGYKAVSRVLGDFHRNDDLESAFWLIQTLPDGLIDGEHLAVSDRFMEWIERTCKANGILLAGKETELSDKSYRVGDYIVRIYPQLSFENDEIIIGQMKISCGGISRTIYRDRENIFEDPPVEIP